MDELYEALIAAGYSRYCARRTCCDLRRIRHVDLQEAIRRWVQTGEQTTIAEHGISTQTLQRKLGMKYPGTFIFIDWLREDPAAAMESMACRSGR